MPRFALSSLRIRLTFLILLVIVPATGLILYSGMEERRLAVAEAMANALRLTKLAASNYEEAIEGTRQLLVTLAELREVRARDRTACSALFATLRTRYSRYASFGVVDARGNSFCTAFPPVQPINAADRPYFQRAVQTRAFAIGDYQVGRVSKKPTLNFAYPVLDKAGQVRAVVFAALDLAYLNRLAAEARLPEGAVLAVSDARGTILARYPDMENWVGRSVAELPAFKASLAQGEGVMEGHGVDGILRLYGFTTLGERPGAQAHLVVGFSRAATLSEADRILRRNLILLGLIGALSLVVAWLGSDLLVLRRVRALVAATGRLRAGDLGARTGLPHAQGELGHLAAAFDELAESLERREAERKRAEEALQESELWLRAVFESLEEALFVVTPDRRVVTANRAAQWMLGYTVEELRSQSTERLHVDHDHYVEFGKRIAEAFGRGEAAQFEFRLRRKSGEVFPTEHTVSLLGGVAGEPLGIVSVVRDVTARKRAEEALRANEVRYKSLFETAREAIFVSGPDGRLIAANPAAAAMRGYQHPDEMIGGRAVDAYADPRQREAIFAELMERGYAEDFEVTLLRRDGAYIEARGSAVLEKAPDGGIRRAFAFVTDVTERKRVERALRESEEKHRQVLDHIDEVVYMVRTTASDTFGGTVQFVSSRVKDLLGYQPDEFLADPGLWFRSLHSEDVPGLVASTQAILETRKGSTRTYRMRHRESGENRWMEDRVVPQLDDAGSVVGIFGVARDITDRKRTEEALATRTRQLETVRSVTEDILRELDLTTVLNLIIRRAVWLVGAAEGVVFLWDEASQVLVPKAWQGLEDWVGEVRIRLGESVTGTVAQRREGMVVNDYRASQYALPLFVERTGISAAVAEPLLFGDRLVGAVVVGRDETQRPFVEQDRETLALFAAQAAIAIENARLHDTTLRGARQLATLTELNRLLTTTLDPQVVAQEILAALQRLIPDAVGRLWERLGDTEILRLVAGIGLRDPTGGVTLTTCPGEGVTGIAAATRRPVICQDVRSDPRFLNRDWAAAEGLVSCIILPLVHGELVHGVLGIYTQTPHHFADEEVSLLQSFAAQATVALANARLFEQVRAGRERLQALSRRLLEVQESERRSIARELHDEIGQLLTGLKLTIEMSARLPTGGSQASLDEARDLVSDLLAKVRDLSLTLRPAMLDDLGLLPALLWHLDRYTAQTRIQVRLEHSGLDRGLPPEVATAAYRIAQEALTNVARHAGVSEVAVRLRADGDALWLQVEDHGAGFEVARRPASGGTGGLTGMRERVELLGGQLVLESAPGAGTRLMVEIPLAGPLERRRDERHDLAGG